MVYRTLIVTSHHLYELRKSWGWYFALGLLLVLVGILAISLPLISGIAVAIYLGAALLVAGVAQIVGSFYSRAWGAYILNLAMGIVYVVVGLHALGDPADFLIILTVLVTAGLLVVGTLRIVVAILHRFDGWGLMLLSGLIDVILGVMIWQRFPGSAIWVIGVFLGVTMIISGMTWLTFALSLSRLPAPPASTETAGA